MSETFYQAGCVWPGAGSPTGERTIWPGDFVKRGRDSACCMRKIRWLEQRRMPAGKHLDAEPALNQRRPPEVRGIPIVFAPQQQNVGRERLRTIGGRGSL